eukprot:EG_transcript_9050
MGCRNSVVHPPPPVVFNHSMTYVRSEHLVQEVDDDADKLPSSELSWNGTSEVLMRVPSSAPSCSSILSEISSFSSGSSEDSAIGCDSNNPDSLAFASRRALTYKAGRTRRMRKHPRAKSIQASPSPYSPSANMTASPSERTNEVPVDDGEFLFELISSLHDGTHTKATRPGSTWRHPGTVSPLHTPAGVALKNRGYPPLPDLRL